MVRCTLKECWRVKNPRFMVWALALLAVLGTVIPVRADMAPPGPPHGANLSTTATTQVRMMSETVLMEVGKDGTEDLWEAKVTANFTMRNLSDVAEDLDVRFPLYFTYAFGELSCENPFPEQRFPWIDDLQVWVDGVQHMTRTEYVTVTMSLDEENFTTRAFPCWAHFHIAFPPQKDVKVKIIYTVEPYIIYQHEYEYAYILRTGASWNGTIGSADLRITFPTELTNENFYGCQPEGCTRGEREVAWHFEDIEPERDVRVQIMVPAYWEAIQRERTRVANHPEDGEAWGRLAKAYKEAGTDLKWMMLFSEPIDFYQLSKEAYEKALALLPNDAAWHYGYAELLCLHANGTDIGNHLAAKDDWVACAHELNKALDLGYSYQEIQKSIRVIPTDIADLSDEQPNFLILTPKPTHPTPKPVTIPPFTYTRQPTATKTATPKHATSTATEVASLPTTTQLAAVPATVTPPLPAAPIPTSSFLPAVLGMLAVLLAVGLGVLRRWCK